jgi:hypothetical protein
VQVLGVGDLDVGVDAERREVFEEGTEDRALGQVGAALLGG